MIVRRAAAFLVIAAAAGALQACAPKPADLGLNADLLDDQIGRRIGSPGTCVVVAKDGQIVYRWGTHVVCGRSLPACVAPGETTVEDLATAGEVRRISCPSGVEVASWWSGAGRTRAGRVTFAASMAGPDALPAIEVERRLTPVLARGGLTVEPAAP